MNIEEYKKTIDILKGQKNILIRRLEDNEDKNIQSIIDYIIYIDKKNE